MTTSLASAPASDAGQTGLRQVAMAGLLALIAVVYWPGLGGGYAFDDFPNIVFNRRLQVDSTAWSDWLAAALSSPASDLQRPLSMLTLAINHYFTGLDPRPMKMTNLAIHLFNTALVLALAKALLRANSTSQATTNRREWAACLIAATWALHPINLTSVLYVVQRMESLGHTFVFAGLWLYLQGRRRQLMGGNGWGLMGTGLVLGTGLGLLAKESAVLLPLYAFCMELCVLKFRGQEGRRDRRLYVLYALVLFLPGLLGMLWLLPKALAPGAYASRDFTLTERLLTEGRVVMDYLRWSVFPSLRELGLHHDDYRVSRGLWQPPSTLLSLIALGGLFALAAWLRHQRPLIALGILWFLGAQLLTATFIPLELVHEHRNYFASLGICLGITDLLLLAPIHAGMRRICVVLATLALTGFILTTHLRAREWGDPLRFAITEAAKHPQSPRSTYTLGQTLLIMSRYRSDSPLLAEGRKALERARLVPGSGILPHSSLLLVSTDKDSREHAALWADMQQRLRESPVGPQEANAIASLSRCAREQGCAFPQAQMIRTFEAALSRGANAEILSIYSDYAFNVLRHPSLALKLRRESIRAQPNMAQYRIDLVKLLIVLRQHPEARAQIDDLRSLGRFGQNEAIANELQQRLDATVPARPSTPAADGH